MYKIISVKYPDIVESYNSLEELKERLVDVYDNFGNDITCEILVYDLNDNQLILAVEKRINIGSFYSLTIKE